MADAYRYVVLGGGMVAGYAAQQMVENGLERNELAIVSADTAPPYERPPLSKGFLAGREDESSIYINSPEFYAEHGIDLLLNTRAVALDPTAKRLQFANGQRIGYERLLIATGARVRTFAELSVPGDGLPGVFYLRLLDDAKRIRERAAGARQAVVVGAGFIGIETAASLRERGLEVTMIFPEDRFWPQFFTPEMSAFYQRYYEGKGVRILPGRGVARFEGSGRLEAVVTSTGERLPCDLAVCGLGVVPETEMYAQAGLAVENGVRVDEQLRTSAPDVWAAGDIAFWPDPVFGKRRRVEHWDVAVEQGKLAARNMMGAGESYNRIPYYFSDEFDLSFEFWGDQEGYDRAIVRGAMDENKSFSVWFVRGTRLLAAFVMNRPDEERDLAQEWIVSKAPVPLDRLADASQPLR